MVKLFNKQTSVTVTLVCAHKKSNIFGTNVYVLECITYVFNYV